MDNNDKSLATLPSDQSPQSEPHPHTPYPQAAPLRAGGNQGLTTALIVIVVALLFILLIFSLNSNGLFAQKTKEDTTTLLARNAQLRADANAARQAQGLPPYPDGANSARTMADRIQRDATSLASLTSQWEKEFARKDEALRKLEMELSAHSQNSQQLYGQIAELQKRLAAAGDASTQVISLKNNLQDSQNQISLLRQQLDTHQGRPTNDQLAALNQQLQASEDRAQKLTLQIDGLLKSKQDSVELNKYNEALAELEKIRPLVNTQRYEIQRLRALLDRSNLFIDSYKDLPAEAATLFERLRGLEETNPQQLASAYQSIGKALNARIVHRQTFSVGSSQVPFTREAIIREAITKNKGTQSFYLVVGYASQTGGKEANRELSAKRATTVASMVNTIKDSGQQVKAVYLGETKRFSAEDNQANQICEVWEIKK